MLAKKICMLGGYAVGKTSLVKRFVYGMFSEKYLTTIGVKIDKQVVGVDGQDVTLVLWDLAGEDGFEKVRLSYLRGASGYLLVVDGTRRATLDTAIKVQQKAHEALGDVPFLVLVNKGDVREQWTIRDSDIRALEQKGWRVMTTSAKDGSSVKEAFQLIAHDTVGAQPDQGATPE